MKRQLAALLLTIFALSLTACGETAAESETRTVYAMDTVMNLTVYGENAAAALESAEKELHTLDEAVLSRTAEGSELYALNTSNGETVECGADDILPALIETALTISDATDGAFDPTLAPVLDAWGFTKDERRVPSADELKELLSHTGCGKVALEKRRTAGRSRFWTARSSTSAASPRATRRIFCARSLKRRASRPRHSTSAVMCSSWGERPTAAIGASLSRTLRTRRATLASYRRRISSS